VSSLYRFDFFLDFLALFLGAGFFAFLAAAFAVRLAFAFFFARTVAISLPVMGLLDSAGNASKKSLNCSVIDFFAMIPLPHVAWKILHFIDRENMSVLSGADLETRRRQLLGDQSEGVAGSDFAAAAGHKASPTSPTLRLGRFPPGSPPQSSNRGRSRFHVGTLASPALGRPQTAGNSRTHQRAS
jgi:hypothetical protein